MNVDIIPVAGRIHAARLMDAAVVVLDVLRSTTCMITALEHGAIKIIPTSDAGEAASFVSRLGSRENLLAGETGGLKTQGFDLGNSPFEFTPAAVKGRSVIMSTTNGTAAVCSVAGADIVLIGGMVNARAVAKKLSEMQRNVLIVCSGTDGSISADDLIAAGAIAQDLKELCPDCVETDITLLCRTLYRDYANGTFDASAIHHWKKLIELGFAEDVAYCFQKDSIDRVPMYSNGIVQ